MTNTGISFGSRYKTKKQAKRTRDYNIAFAGLEVLKKKTAITGLIVQDGHDSSLQPGNPRADLIPHITAMPLTAEGEPDPHYELHIYLDGSSNYKYPE